MNSLFFLKILLFISITFFYSAFASCDTEDVIFNLPENTLHLAPGRVESIQVNVQLPKNFHAYSDKFKIKEIVPDIFKIGEIQVLDETNFYDKFSNKNRKGFYEKGVLKLQLETPIDIDPKNTDLKFNLYYQICSEKFCHLPRMKTLTLKVAINNLQKINTSFVATAIGKESQDSVPLIEKLQSALSENIFYAFLIAFFAGLLTSFTPCIFPMIPITISILGHDAEKNSRTENFFRSVIYVLGIAFTYSFLGVLAALTGHLFGNALSNRYVLIFLVILFFTMALSMWGLFDLQVPAFIRNKFGVGKKHGFMGIFTMGLISGIVASPCVGPVLVSILSYVSTTQNIFLGFGLLFTYAIGLGLIFIIIGLFGQFLSLLPKSGRWMNKIKFLLGLFMLLTSFYYLRLLLPNGHQAESNWKIYSAENLEIAQQKKQPVMIDFRADWCGACLEMEEKTFSRSEFSEMAKDFMLLKVDVTNESESTQALLKKYDVKGLPTVLFLNRNGTILNNLTLTQFVDWSDLKLKMISTQKVENSER